MIRTPFALALLAVVFWLWVPNSLLLSYLSGGFYVSIGLVVALTMHLWKVGRRIDALEDALEAEKDIRRAASSRSATRPG